jgi:phosphatidate cytidylyltransferase
MNSRKDHQDRWITGVVGLTVVLLIVGYGSRPIFFLFLLLIIFLVLKEFYNLVSGNHSSRFLGIILGLTLTGGFFALEKSTLIATMTGIGFFLCLLFIITLQNSETANPDLGKHLIGIFIIAFLLSHLIWLRDLKEGPLWIFFLLSVVFAGDTFALYGGKFWGYHKLSPKISPGKTVEGAVSGLIGSSLGGILFALFFFPDFSKIVIVPLSIIIGILGQLGDLWESALKRKAMVKDSGWLLPGHGGFLDRGDSILFTAPFLYYFILFQEGSL